MTKFRDNILRIAGPRGQAWLDNLPNLVCMLSKKWDLKDCESFPPENCHYHQMVKAYLGENPVIIKIGVDRFSLQKEMLALETFGGQGCVKLIDHDLDTCALLIEQVTPGTVLTNFFPDKDGDAVHIASLLIHKLHSSLPSDKTAFPTIKDWLEAFDSPKVADLPMLHQAKNLAKQLLKTSEKPILLHGDLHHDNILYNGAGQWIAIDPKGVMGEPAYEVGAFIRNPINQILAENNLISLLEKRINAFARCLDLEPWRVRDWAFVQCILAACWSIEDNGDPKSWLLLAQVLREIPTSLLNQ